MKILIVSLFFPYPKVTHAGGTNLFHYIEALQQCGHQISLLSFIQDCERPLLSSMKPYCVEIETVPAISGVFQRFAKAPYLLKYPAQWVEAFSRPMRRTMRAMLNRRHFDLVHFEHLWMTQFLDLVHDCATALDEVDVDSVVLFRRSRQAANWLVRQYLRWCWQRTVQLEVNACEKVDLVLTRSDKDRKYLQCLAPNRNIRVLPPWFEGLQQPAALPDQMEPHTLLFVGNMGRGPNVDAVLYFCKRILPQVLAVVPDARLYIVGDAPSEQIQRLADKHIIVTGYVPDLREYYARCQVFIAPLLIGGGIIVKILDALAAGRPVVCTSVACEGIETVSGRELYVADTAEKFAQRTIELLTDERSWQELAANGRALIERQFDWEHIVNDLEQVYLETLRQKAR
jgi:polysaccharide biosynthesis protein PslH